MVIWSVEISPPVRQISYKWPTLTNTRIGEGKLYLSAIKDEFSNRIAGYNIDSRTKYCRKAGVFTSGKTGCRSGLHRSPVHTLWPVAIATSRLVETVLRS